MQHHRPFLHAGISWKYNSLSSIFTTQAHAGHMHGQHFHRGCRKTNSWVESQQISCFFVRECKKGIQKILLRKVVWPSHEHLKSIVRFVDNRAAPKYFSCGTSYQNSPINLCWLPYYAWDTWIFYSLLPKWNKIINVYIG